VARLRLYPTFTLLAAAGLLIVFAVQYPLQTTFPIGGDAAAHIRTTQTILGVIASPHDAWTALRTSNYPLAQISFGGLAALPLSWPERFTWWMVASHILTGAALAALLWRIGSWRAAAAGMAIWALTPVGINTHFEDGTAPQLFSLIFLLLAFERLVAGKRWGVLFAVAAAALTHPLTGFILIASLIMGTAIVFPVRARLAPSQAKTVKYLGILIAFLFLAGIARTVVTGISWPFVEQQSADFFLLDALKSKFAPWLVLSLPGLAVVTGKLRRSLLASASLLSFFWLSFLLTANSNLNVGLWENRFRTYFILAVCIAAALALPALLRSAFRHPLSRSLCLILLFGSLAIFTWRDNAAVYRHYENPDNHARLHPTTIAAMTWLSENLPPDSYIASSAASRQTEWIPVLTPFSWQELNAAHDLFTAQGEALVKTARALPFTHIIFLTDQENVNPNMVAQPDAFPVVFANDTTVIIRLP
jgi:hypothetical protein